tara:strand:- start:20 stop:835 length:816 start_codon:yes stop_codon:yes gene_type:complete
MTRHRGTYKPDHTEPYELGRSQIEHFKKCPACYWLKRVKGVKFPGMPGFLLNTATDTLLKKDFDVYREKGQPHPFMKRHGLGHLVPYNHKDFDLWTKALQLGLRTFHNASGFIVGGGLDDVWHNPATDEIHIVDYKSTATKRNKDLTALETITLEGAYKSGYKRQLEIYQWIMRQNGFNVSDIGYFLFVNGDQHFADGMLEKDKDKANMSFEVQLIEHKGDDNWVERKILDLKECLVSPNCPDHSTSGFGPKGNKECEYLTLFKGLEENNL